MVANVVLAFEEKEGHRHRMEKGCFKFYGQKLVSVWMHFEYSL